MIERLVAVTGGGRGIGRAVVRRFGAAGHRLVALGRDRRTLEEAVGPLGDRGDARVCDVTDPESVARAFQDLSVDVLVNNAGAAASAPVERTELDEWERLMAVNASGAFLCTRAVLGGMRRRGWGRILTVASTAGLVGTPYTVAYSASKHAALGLMRVVAAEVAGSGVTANAVCPGFVNAPMTEEAVARIVEVTGRTNEEARAALEASMPLGRLVEPEEVAAALAFLASEEAAAINGQTIVLDGGGIQR